MFYPPLQAHNTHLLKIIEKGVSPPPLPTTIMRHLLYLIMLLSGLNFHFLPLNLSFWLSSWIVAFLQSNKK